VFNKVEAGPSAFSDGDQKPNPELGTIKLKIQLGKLNKDLSTAPRDLSKSFLSKNKVEHGSVDQSITDRAA